MAATHGTRRSPPPSTSPAADDDSSSLLSSLRRTLSKFHEAVGGGGGGGIGADSEDGEGIATDDGPTPPTAGGTTRAEAATAGSAESKEGGDEAEDRAGQREDRRFFRPHDPAVGFRERLATYRPEVYFAKPDEVSPLVCARFGWECTDARDVLSCTHPGCRGAVCVWLGEEGEGEGEGRDRSGGGDDGGEAPTTSDVGDDGEEDAAIARAITSSPAGPDVVRTLCRAYRRMLATEHDAKLCPWRADAERWLILDDDDDGDSDGASAGGKGDGDGDGGGHRRGRSVVVVPPFLLSVLPQLAIFEGPCVGIGDDGESGDGGHNYDDGGVQGRLVRFEARRGALELDRALDDAAVHGGAVHDGAKRRRRCLRYDVATPEELLSFFREGMGARRRRPGRRCDGDNAGAPGDGVDEDNYQDPAEYIRRVLNANVDGVGVGYYDGSLFGPGSPTADSGAAPPLAGATTQSSRAVTKGSALLAALGWSPLLPPSTPTTTAEGCVRVECRICLATGDVGLTYADEEEHDDDEVKDPLSRGRKRRRHSPATTVAPAGGHLVDAGDDGWGDGDGVGGGKGRSDDPEIAAAPVKKMRTGDDSYVAGGELAHGGARKHEAKAASSSSPRRGGADGLDPVNSHRHFCPYVGGCLYLRPSGGGARRGADRSAGNRGPRPSHVGVEEDGPPLPTTIPGWQIVVEVLLRGGTGDDGSRSSLRAGPKTRTASSGERCTSPTESWKEALLAVNKALGPARAS